jgi:hypothetical protein
MCLVNFKKLIIFIFFAAINFLGYTQSEISICAAKNIFDKNVLLIGEFHYKKINNVFLIEFAKQLIKDGAPLKKIVMERSPAYCYLLNKYMHNNDTFSLSIIELDEAVSQYKRFRKFLVENNLTSATFFESADVDNKWNPQIPHFAVRCILLNFSKYQLTDSLRVNELGTLESALDQFQRKPKPQIWGNKTLRYDLDCIETLVNSTDSNKLKEGLGSSYADLKEIIYSYTVSKKKECRPAVSQVREEYMAAHIYNCFLEDQSGIIFGMFGSYHVRKESLNEKRKSKRLAEILDHDPKYASLNNKVVSALLIYPDISLKKQKIKNLISERTFPEGNNSCNFLFQKYAKSQALDYAIYVR